MNNLAVRTKCRLLDINRSNFYYKSRFVVASKSSAFMKTDNCIEILKKEIIYNKNFFQCINQAN